MAHRNLLFGIFCFFLLLNNAEATDKDPLNLASLPPTDEWMDESLMRYLAEWMNEYPTFTDEEYEQRLMEMSGIIQYKLHPVVKERIIARTEKYRSSTEKILGMGEIYFPVFEEYLARYDVPHHLKYLPVIESRLNPVAKSIASAVGLWQFIPSTGKFYGLRINSTVDERSNTHLASNAAAKMLSELYKYYDDWALALAAYNCGPGRVNKAIRSAGTKDYWVVRNYLPTETQKYVPYFMAVVYVGEYHKIHDLTPTQEAETYRLTDTIRLDKGISLYKLAEDLDMSIDTLKFLNPGYLKNYVPAHPEGSIIVLPTKKVAELRGFTDAIERIKTLHPDNPVRSIRRINSFEDVEFYAKAYRCSVKDILYWNELPETYLFQPGDIIALRKYAAPKDALLIEERKKVEPISIAALRVIEMDEDSKTVPEFVDVNVFNSQKVIDNFSALKAPSTRIKAQASVSSTPIANTNTKKNVSRPLLATSNTSNNTNSKQGNSSNELPERDRGRSLRTYGIAGESNTQTTTQQTKKYSKQEKLDAQNDALSMANELMAHTPQQTTKLVPQSRIKTEALSNLMEGADVATQQRIANTELEAQKLLEEKIAKDQALTSAMRHAIVLSESLEMAEVIETINKDAVETLGQQAKSITAERTIALQKEFQKEQQSALASANSKATDLMTSVSEYELTIQKPSDLSKMLDENANQLTSDRIAAATAQQKAAEQAAQLQAQQETQNRTAALEKALKNSESLMASTEDAPITISTSKEQIAMATSSITNTAIAIGAKRQKEVEKQDAIITERKLAQQAAMQHATALMENQPSDTEQFVFVKDMAVTGNLEDAATQQSKERLAKDAILQAQQKALAEKQAAQQFAINQATELTTKTTTNTSFPNYQKQEIAENFELAAINHETARKNAQATTTKALENVRVIAEGMESDDINTELHYQLKDQLVHDVSNLATKEELNRTNNTTFETTTIVQNNSTSEDLTTRSRDRNVRGTNQEAETATSKKAVNAFDNIYTYHTVQSNESIWDIQKQYSGVSVDDILRLNNLESSSAIRSGMVLKIR